VVMDGWMRRMEAEREGGREGEREVPAIGVPILQVKG
jgi:hypothetical protein